MATILEHSALINTFTHFRYWVPFISTIVWDVWRLECKFVAVRVDKDTLFNNRMGGGDRVLVRRHWNHLLSWKRPDFDWISSGGLRDESAISSNSWPFEHASSNPSLFIFFILYILQLHRYKYNSRACTPKLLPPVLLFWLLSFVFCQFKLNIQSYGDKHPLVKQCAAQQ